MSPAEGQFTGGCQCGAVRFSAKRLGRASICHCRMCQKAFGSFFGPLVTAFGVVWTREEPNYFQSSSKFRRGFCAKCGTPLTYEALDHDDTDPIELAIDLLILGKIASAVLKEDYWSVPWSEENCQCKKTDLQK